MWYPPVSSNPGLRPNTRARPACQPWLPRSYCRGPWPSMAPPRRGGRVDQAVRDCRRSQERARHP
eukprot:1544813-Prorocentrum_lima.AAC.1